MCPTNDLHGDASNTPKTLPLTAMSTDRACSEKDTGHRLIRQPPSRTTQKRHRAKRIIAKRREAETTRAGGTSLRTNTQPSSRSEIARQLPVVTRFEEAQFLVGREQCDGPAVLNGDPIDLDERERIVSTGRQVTPLRREVDADRFRRAADTTSCRADGPSQNAKRP